MTERTQQRVLVKLSDTDFRLEDPWKNIRGLEIYDRDGDEIGTVEDLYIDKEEREVRFLDAGAGSFLGLGERHFMIPVDAITHIGMNGVTINRHREQVVGSPAFDPSVPPETEYQRRLYDYYGYPYPAWSRW